MDGEMLLEEWCEEKKIDSEKIPKKLWRNAVLIIDEAISECLSHHKQDVVGDGSFMIEQELPEHPEWKEKD